MVERVGPITMTFTDEDYCAIIWNVSCEVDRAEKKHPGWPDDIVHAAAIVNEESGELIRAALNHWYFKESKEEIRKEAIQTAATCIRLLKNL